MTHFFSGHWASFVLVASCLLTALGPARAMSAIVFGQVDDFEDGTTMGWAHGSQSPSAPVNVGTGGNAGAADAFLRSSSIGGFGAGSKQIVFNQAQWTGDYNAAGVTRISGWVANFGTTDLSVRVAFEGGASRFSSTRAFDLPAGSGWRRASFDLSDMTRISGSATLSTALSSVRDFRMLSAAGGPSYIGDAVPGTLGFDDLRASRTEGDANFDGVVDGADLQLVRANLGSSADQIWHNGDFNFDGRVNARDVALLRRNFGAASRVAVSDLSVVPEPSGCLPLGISWIALLRRSSRSDRCCASRCEQ